MSTLPEVNNDPLVDHARQLHTSYDKQLGEIRTNTRMSDLAKAEAVDSAWSTYNADLQTTSDKFFAQRISRLRELEAQIPIGPNIPDDTSRADATVLHQAFASAYETAMAADTDGLTQMYRQASRFGDDITARAVMTAATDRDLPSVVDLWASSNPERQADLAETVRLRDLLNGRGIDALFASQAFARTTPRQQPQESRDLPLHRQRAGQS